jgi:hypothetical protein
MSTTATNVYRIENLNSYSAKYRLHRVRGLLSGDADFYRNLDALCTRLSRDLRTPATFLLRDEAFVVLRDDAPEPAQHFQLVRTTAVLERGSEVLTLDFGHLTAETRPIALRFLQFSLQGALWRRRDLWQPRTGGTFFEKEAAHLGETIGLHRGFLARVIDLGEGAFGVCVDVRHKYVSKQPLPAFLNRKSFADRFKALHTIYHYGHEWFEIRLSDFNDLSVTEYQIVKDGKRRSLLEYIQIHSAKPLPPELAHLPKDCAVVHYFNSRDQQMGAPSALCFPVFDTGAPEVRREHRHTILPPHVRRKALEKFTESYLRELHLNGECFQLARQAVEISRRFFRVPDLKFGGGKIISVKGSEGATLVRLDELGKKRLSLLRDKSAGFFVTEPLQRQFFFMPESILDSWGPQFLKDLSVAVEGFYPQENGYEPTIVPYNDSRGPTWVDQARAIVAAAKDQNVFNGFAVVMLHEPGQRRERKEDQLAAFVLSRLYEDFDIRAAVMHTDTGSQCYEMVSRQAYAVRESRRKKLDGYLRNVALNKVLLTNEKWPFVLAERLHADVTIGVDLKAQHVGFTLVGNGGGYIDTCIKKTRFRERLRAEEFQKHLVQVVRHYHERTGQFASNIIIHRDGRMFPSELSGARAGLQQLIDDGFIVTNGSLTCVEIGKHNYASLRLFNVQRSKERGGEFVQNPQVGQYFIPMSSEGYLVATGPPFDREGTVLPLHVRKLEGPLSMDQILEDIYRLTTLTWSRPEDCTRYPITIKLNDRRLFEDAGQYDETEIELQEEEAEL